ncbi:MAG: hypothetical protein Solivirus1_36 [Solivirus sp.]|uniref:Uncharacterized protein n=1 Tax=Solivirus sp. TaxID=2487772 RepID=A0A3G5AJQ7_9VIRU|nr:MAG: hypothetical protein Solivirus1_36 [Solivirus sp.]
MNLTEHDLTTKEILLYLSDSELANYCKTNRDTARICADEGFWIQKLHLKFPNFDTNVKVNKRILYIIQSFLSTINSSQKVRILAKLLFPIITRLDNHETDLVFKYLYTILPSSFAITFKLTIIYLYAQQGDLDIATYYNIPDMSLLPYVSLEIAKEIIDVFYEHYQVQVQRAKDNDHDEDWIDENIKSPLNVYVEYANNWPADKALLFLTTCFNEKMSILTLLIKKRYYETAAGYYLETPQRLLRYPAEYNMPLFIAELDEILSPEQINTFLICLYKSGIEIKFSDLEPFGNIQMRELYELERAGILPTEQDLSNGNFDRETSERMHEIYVRHGGI